MNNISILSLARKALSLLPETATVSDAAVLAILCTYANSEGRGIRPRAQTIADLSRLSKRRVWEIINRLEGFGVLADDGMHVTGRIAVPLRRIVIPGVEIIEPDDDENRTRAPTLPRTPLRGTAPPCEVPHPPASDAAQGCEVPHPKGCEVPHPSPISPHTPLSSVELPKKEDSPLYLSEVPPQNGVTAAPPQDKGGKRPCRSPSGLAEIDSFQDFYSRYPRHVDRGHAENMWNWALTHGATAREIIEGLERQLPSMQGREAKFIPHPGTWLRGKRWLDEAPPTWQEDLARVARELSTTDTEAWFKPYLNGEIT